MRRAGMLLEVKEVLLTGAKENGISEPDNVVQASDQILRRMRIKPGLVWGGEETSHETSSSVSAEVAKCYHQSDEASVQATNTQGHNHTCLSGKFPLHLFHFLKQLVLLGVCVWGRGRGAEQ